MAKLWIIMLFLSGLVRGFKWEHFPDDNVYACAGNKVTLPWRFTLGENERAGNVYWIHDGALASEMVATLVDGKFVPTARYAPARARHVRDGGLVLETVSAEDSGNYSLKVVVDDQGEVETWEHTVSLYVGDGLMIEGGQLRVEQDPVAQWNQSSRLFSLRLTCGSFPFLASPPLDVVWTTPKGEQTPSTGYESGVFYLSLPTPVKGGKYTCTVPPVHWPDVCLRDQDGAHQAVSADLPLDELRARLSLLEANQRALSEENERLRANQTALREDSRRLQGGQEELRARSDRVEGKLREVERTHARDVENVTDYCRDSQSSVQKQIEDMQTAQQSMLDKIETLWNRTNDEEEEGEEDLSNAKGPCHPDNHTVIDDARRAVQPVADQHDRDLCDNKLRAGWYRFLLDKAKAVVPTACVPVNNCHTDAPTWVDLQGQPLPKVGQQVDARACSHWDSDCCNWQAPVTVRNCGGYYVYKIQPLRTCDLSFCLEPQK